MNYLKEQWFQIYIYIFQNSSFINSKNNLN